MTDETQASIDNTGPSVEARPEHHFYRAAASDFKKIPGSPIAYWVSSKILEVFEVSVLLEDIASVRHGLSTGKNEDVVRTWPEVSLSDFGTGFKDRENAVASGFKWFPYNKGGTFRKWMGNWEYVLRYDKYGNSLMASFSGHRHDGKSHYFKEGVTWTFVSSSQFAARYTPLGFVFDVSGSSLFGERPTLLTGFLCSNLCYHILKALNPTLNFQVGNLKSLPCLQELVCADQSRLSEVCEYAIRISKLDWDSYETSWDFTELPLLQVASGQWPVTSQEEAADTLATSHQPLATPSLSEAYAKLRTHWRERTLEMQRLEEENNRIFIEAYGLEEELTPEVPLEEITLTCNPRYRYQLSGQWLVASDQKKQEELEKRLLEDTMKELVSYAVGCMFGRYSLDKPGIVLANQGETLADYCRKVASGQWLVASGQWLVASNTGDINEREALQGSDRLAEGDESGGTGLSGNEGLSQGGTVRTDQSVASSSGVDSVQHSRRASETIGGGVPELSVDSAGIVGRSGDANPDCDAPEIFDEGAGGFNHGHASGNQQNDSGSDGKTGHWPLATGHLSFAPDSDNVLPITEAEWFQDDIVARFRQFLRVTFGEESLGENIRFIEDALGKDLRKYFFRDFYKHHVKMYKKRPIYWLFSSPKGTFNALIYMHRYRPDTVGVVLNDYLREHIHKLRARLDHLNSIEDSSLSAREKTARTKEVDKLNKALRELEDYERDILHPLAQRRLEIDLDDGVKVNYAKFGNALAAVKGLNT